jgi:hypothetical protein
LGIPSLIIMFLIFILMKYILSKRGNKNVSN